MNTQYTPWRKFLAWVGFTTIILIVSAAAIALYVTNVYINANLYV